MTTPPAYKDYAGDVANRYGIPQNLFFSMIQQESGWNAGARSSAGAIGLGQLMPGTAADLGVNPYDWRQNLEGAGKYLSDQYKKFGRWDLALSAYNSGPGGSEKFGRVEGFAETQNYVDKIMKNAGAGVGTFMDGFLSPIPGVGLSDLYEMGKEAGAKKLEGSKGGVFDAIVNFFTKDTLVRAVAIVIGLVLLAAAVATFVAQSKAFKTVVNVAGKAAGPVGKVASAVLD